MEEEIKETIAQLNSTKWYRPITKWMLKCRLGWLYEMQESLDNFKSIKF